MRVRMASFSGFAVAAVVILAGASPAGAQQVVKFGEGQTLTISGFVSVTLFTDHGLFGGFGQGQNAEWAAQPADQPTSDKLFTDGDVRNTRINFTFSAGPVLVSGHRRPRSRPTSSGRSTATHRSGTSSRRCASGSRTSTYRTAARR